MIFSNKILTILFSLFTVLFFLSATPEAMANSKKLVDMPKLKAFTRADMQIPDEKTQISSEELQGFVKEINSKKSKLNGLTLNASSISKGVLKDVSHKGIKNIMTLEFLKLKTENKKTYLVVELNSFKIGKMPFNAYVEMEVPLESIFKDKNGVFYIDYKVGDGLRDINFVKVMGTKSKVKNFSFIYSKEQNKAEFYLYSLDKIAFMGEVEMSLFGKGDIL